MRTSLDPQTPKAHAGQVIFDGPGAIRVLDTVRNRPPDLIPPTSHQATLAGPMTLGYDPHGREVGPGHTNLQGRLANEQEKHSCSRRTIGWRTVQFRSKSMK